MSKQADLDVCSEGSLCVGVRFLLSLRILAELLSLLILFLSNRSWKQHLSYLSGEAKYFFFPCRAGRNFASELQLRRSVEAEPWCSVETSIFLLEQENIIC